MSALSGATRQPQPVRPPTETARDMYSGEGGSHGDFCLLSDVAHHILMYPRRVLVHADILTRAP